MHAQRHISIYFSGDYSSPGTDKNFHHFIKQSRGSLLRYTFQRELTFVASHSPNITYNSVYNQCCTVCGCPAGCINSKHCLPLCATGLQVRDNSVEKMLFSKTILSHSTRPYPGYFLCIPLARFPMRGHLSRLSEVYQTTEANFIPSRNDQFSNFCHCFCQLLSVFVC